MLSNLSQRTLSLITFALCALVMVAAAMFVVRQGGEDLAAAFSPLVMGAVIAVAAVGVLLAAGAGFPEYWQSSVGWRARFLIPAFIGAVFGAITLVQVLAERGWTLPTDRSGALPLAIAAPLFLAGGLLLEMMLRQGGLVVGVRLLRLIPRMPASAAFWIVVVLVSLYEPWPYMSGTDVSEIATALRLLVFNLATAYVMWRAGFLAALTLRLSDYVVWHLIGQSVLGLS